MTDLIILLITAAVIGAVVIYLVRAKKRGERCIGCPYAKECAKKQGGCTHKNP